MEKKKLLVVVDMQNDFVTGVLGTKEAQAIVEPMAEYIKNFDGDVIFTQDTHHKNYLDTQEGKKLPVPHCVKNTDGWQIVDELNDIPGRKFYKPAFGSLELGKEIRKYYADADIYFVGICTGICVISNVMLAKSFAPEAKIHVIDNLCACVTPESHKTAIEAMRTCQVDII